MSTFVLERFFDSCISIRDKYCLILLGLEIFEKLDSSIASCLADFAVKRDVSRYL